MDNTETTTGARRRHPLTLDESWEVIAGLAAKHTTHCHDHGFVDCVLLKAAVDIYAAKKNASQDRITQALVDALKHAIYRNHGHQPSSCGGCEEADRALALVERTKEGGGK